MGYTVRVGHIQTIKRRGRVPNRYAPSPGGDERHDLCAGAVIVGAEQTTADAAGDAVLLRPFHGFVKAQGLIHNSLRL